MAPAKGVGLGGAITRASCTSRRHDGGGRAMRARRQTALATAAAIFLVLAPPARAQVVVYDPSNYAQNALQAARALQQINNQITSLQNQTQMLLNQVKNLTSLPYSALQAIEQSFAR